MTWVPGTALETRILKGATLAHTGIQNRNHDSFDLFNYHFLHFIVYLMRFSICCLCIVWAGVRTKKSSCFFQVFASMRVLPPDVRPLSRRSRQKVDFLHRESTPEAKNGEKGPRVGRLGRDLV